MGMASLPLRVAPSALRCQCLARVIQSMKPANRLAADVDGDETAAVQLDRADYKRQIVYKSTPASRPGRIS